MKKLNVEEHVIGLPVDVNSSFVATNAYRIKCEPTGYNQSYNLCQHIVNAKRTGKLDSMKSCEACSAALSKVECPAIHMMLAEKKAGRVLFYEHFDPAVVNYPEKPMRDTKEISRSWFSKDMLIPTTKIIESNKDNSGVSITTLTRETTVDKSKQPEKLIEKIAPKSIDNIYEMAMMETFQKEKLHNAVP
uniref:Uncharacterized protein n=1 Tax=Pectobacterium carotovorum TaxID=554 RepID=A0A0K0MPG7_PECCA|nr:hypothetical protein [Pectobacterium carotovorum]AKG47503.1 hypothetical protein pA_00063 [Pectobacterium carotovorum]